MHSIEFFLIAGSVLLILSVLASKATGRFGVPSLLVFLAVGMLAGSEGLGGIYFDSPYYAKVFGVIALSYILFSGGLDTDLKIVKKVALPGILLATLGVAITCLVTGAFATWILGFTWVEGLLLGAIVSSTDAAAVFNILRARSVNFKGQIRPLLELESGLNDPMGVLLTIAFLKILTTNETSVAQIILHIIQQFILGGVIGFSMGKGAIQLLNKIKLESSGLYPVLTLALVVLVYGLAEAIGGNGFLAVYLAGLVMGNKNFVHKKSLILFHDGVAWLVQIGMFLILGLLVYPSKLIPVVGVGILISVILILVARPMAVFLSLTGSKFTHREKAMVSWVGLRGSVPIILATYPYIAGAEKADLIFHLVFFIVITSVLIQGSFIPTISNWLKVDAPVKKKFRYPIEYVPIENMRSDLTEVEISKNSHIAGKTILDLNLPNGALIVLIQRQGNVIVPRGGTVLESGDTMLVLADKESLRQVKDLVRV